VEGAFHPQLQGRRRQELHAFLLAQYYRQRQAPVVCFDADATTSTFSSFAALDVTRIELMQGPRIDERRFDLILEKS
jgi:hypothetical protein